MKKKILVTVTLLIIIFLIPVLLTKRGFFVINNPINSNKLLIEGWLSTNMLDNPPFEYKDYDTIFISGLRRVPNWNKLLTYKERFNNNETWGDSYYMPSDGFIFLRNIAEKIPDSTITRVDVIAKGTSALGISAHFYLSIKDSLIGQSFAGNDFDTIHFNVHLKKHQLGLLNIFFDNDLLTKTEDINLVIKGIIINNVSFLTKNGELTFIPSHYEGEIFDLFASNSLELKAYLETYIKPTATIIAVDSVYNGRNKTRAEAKAFLSYLIKHKIALKSLNIYTQDFHSRRTNLAYRQVLGSAVQIGTFANSCPNCTPSQKYSFVYNLLQTYDEFISWFITLFS